MLHLGDAFVLGFIIAQISWLTVSPAPTDCLAATNTCMSDLCQSERAFYGTICKANGCQIKGLEACNMTIKAVLDQLPSLRGCVCAWEGEDLCGSIHELATQCPRKPGAQQKRRAVSDWKSSTLRGSVQDGAGSCLQRIQMCLEDAVCNRDLLPVLQACQTHQCNPDWCQQAVQQFYASMPHGVAELLVMCECDASDQSCHNMRSLMHSGMCGDDSHVCLETVRQCVEDQHCRELLKIFRAKCWNPEEAHCGDSDLDLDCFTRMDPALLLGGDLECKRAFVATMGTVLHFPCTCQQEHGSDIQTCDMIYSVFHNRSHFVTAYKKMFYTSKPPEISKSEEGPTWPIEYLIYAFAIVLLVGFALLMSLAVISKRWMLRRQDKTRVDPPLKSNCAVL